VVAYFIGLGLGSVKYSMFTFGFGFLVVLLVGDVNQESTILSADLASTTS
jgi:hypothetical protein